MAFPTEKVSDNDYRLLGLSPSASQAEVKKAYRDLVKRWHPDVFQQRSSFERQRAEERFKEITGAYRRISRKSQEAPDQENRAHSPKEEPTSAPQSQRRAQASAASKDSSGSSYRPRKPYRSAADSSRFYDLKVGYLRFIKGLIQRSHLKWNQRSIGVLLFILLFFIFLGLTSIPKWFSHRSESRAPETTHRSRENISDQPLDISQPDTASPDRAERGASVRQTMPPHPQSLSPPLPHGQAKSYFTLGSTQAEVLRIQGSPDRVHGQTWIYGLSEIHFREGQVWRYHNFDGSLRVQVLPTLDPNGEKLSFFTLGSNKNDILLVQGTPTRVEANKWYYGFSEIRFKNGRVEEYDNYFGDLNVRLLPSRSSPPALRRGPFTLGATMDEVLAIQGTPTSIQGNYWYYHSSSILFRDKKVQYVVNSGGNLHFIPSEEPAN